MDQIRLKNRVATLLRRHALGCRALLGQGQGRKLGLLIFSFFSDTFSHTCVKILSYPCTTNMHAPCELGVLELAWNWEPRPQVEIWLWTR